MGSAEYHGKSTVFLPDKAVVLRGQRVASNLYHNNHCQLPLVQRTAQLYKNCTKVVSQ
jgi:hypothetical protein